MIKIKFFGFLKKFMPDVDAEGFWCIDRPGITVGEVFELAKVPEEYRRATLLVNRTRKSPDYQLQPGDILTVMPLVAGG